MLRPEFVNNLSTDPLSFHNISFNVGGARSKVVTMSLVCISCSFIDCESIPFCSSTKSFLRRFGRLSTDMPLTPSNIYIMYDISNEDHTQTKQLFYKTMVCNTTVSHPFPMRFFPWANTTIPFHAQDLLKPECWHMEHWSSHYIFLLFVQYGGFITWETSVTLVFFRQSMVP